MRSICTERHREQSCSDKCSLRRKQIGFSVACVAELLLPHGGLFSSVSSANLEQFSQVALAAVAASAGVAALSKPRIGSQLREVRGAFVWRLHSTMTCALGSRKSS